MLRDEHFALRHARIFDLPWRERKRFGLAAVGGTGDTYITGSTSSTDFPTTLLYQNSFAGAPPTPLSTR
jgi:hypothetical protein